MQIIFMEDYGFNVVRRFVCPNESMSYAGGA
jgi:hypothetical protein